MPDDTRFPVELVAGMNAADGRVAEPYGPMTKPSAYALAVPDTPVVTTQMSASRWNELFERPDTVAIAPVVQSAVPATAP